jgi:Uma2 family endonuclease
VAVNPKNLPRHYYTIEEYFALEHAGDARFEYWDGEVVCMSGGSRRHYAISDNLHIHLARLVEGRNCRAYSGGVPLHTPSLPPYRYPDASVVCGEPVFTNINGVDVLTNPILIVEVLSPGTEHLDKELKRAAYQKISSVVEYLIVSQDAPHVTQYLRQAGSWTRKDAGDMAAIIELPSIGSLMPVGRIYEGVAFD